MNAGPDGRSEPSFRRAKPGVLQRFLLRLVPNFYHGPLAGFLAARCVMLLTVRGRKTGAERTVGVSFMDLGDRLVIFRAGG
jgi:hypothetical protein